MADATPTPHQPGSSNPNAGWQPPTPEALQEQIAAYKVLELLGRGGMGAVYKGWQVSLERYVAIKIMPPDIDDGDAQFAARFKQEAKTMAKFLHPAIVAVFDAGETATGLLYIVMEFVEGTDVAQTVKANGRLPPDHALAITMHVCDALQYAHARGVIHRDIKPANVMLNGEGQVKVADFGLAKATGSAQMGLTRTDMSMGTPDYIAPEALMLGVVADHRADLYAVGVMLYNMLTGDIPRGRFRAAGEKAGTDPRFDAIINKAMEQEREQRYQSALEIRRDLDAILLSLVPQAVEAPPRQVEEPVVVQRPVARRPQPRNDGTPAAAPGAARPVGRKPVTLKKSSAGLIAGIVVAAAVAGAGAFFAFHKSNSKADPTGGTGVTPASSEGRIIDLLPLVDVKRDAIKGNWSRKAEGVSLDFTPDYGVLELPYEPPEEYDFEIEFTPQSNGLNVNQYLVAGGCGFAWKLNAHAVNPPLYGFELLDGKFSKVQPEAAARKDLRLEVGTPMTSRIEVRSSGLRALVNGQEFVKWTGDFRRFSMEDGTKLRNARALGVGAYKRSVIFHKIQVREIGGTGKITGGATPSATGAPASKPAASGMPTTTIPPATTASSNSGQPPAKDWVVYDAKPGPGAGKHIVFLAGDEEYRSEESLPMLAKILSQRHGFKCTVLFTLDKEGAIDPGVMNNLPGAEALDSADAIVMLFRFRALPDAQMKHFADAYLRGVPIIGLRTATHAFKPNAGRYEEFQTFGKRVFGDGWVSHWGEHNKEATRGVIEPAAKNDPILRGVTEIFGNSDVYEVHLPADARILVRGQVLTGMKPGDPPASYKKQRTNDKTEQDVNNPMMPVVWTREHRNEAGRTNRVLCTTMGAATDLQSEGLRRLIVNGVYNLLGLEVPARADVNTVGDYHPSMYAFKGYRQGVKPADLALSLSASDAAASASGWISLLPKIDPAADAVRGRWSRVADGLMGEVDGSNSALILQLPYEVPEEYDFRIRFTRQSGNQAVSQHLAGAKNDVMWLMGGFSNSAWGLEQVNGAKGNVNPTTFKSGIENGRRYESVVKVRHDRVQVEVDGKQVVDYKTDGTEFSMNPKWSFPDPKKLGVGCQQPTVFHSIDVLDVTGKGKLLR